MTEVNITDLSPWQVWMLAARPKTLPAAAAPVVVGSAVAFVDGVFLWGPALAALTAALLLQIGANFANDLFDFQRGADAGERLGPLRVTHSLLPALKDGAKVALITSRMGSIADNDSGGSYGYRMSKAALNAAGVSLAQDLAARGIAIAILHPGYVRTDMTGQSGLIDTDESVAGLLQRINELNAQNSGTFWHTNGEVLPW